MTGLGVFLAGEGRNELGGRCGHPTYQRSDQPGVIETLLRRVRSDGWEVVGSLEWKHIRKLNAKGPTRNEKQTVLGLVLEAKRAQALPLAFLRDADGDKGRGETILHAIAEARELFREVAVGGGVPFPVLEAWILAMLGEHGTEDLSKAGALKQFENRGSKPKDTESMVKVAQEFDRGKLPTDAEGLRVWLDTIETVFEGNA